jgi:hypothetical protein
MVTWRGNRRVRPGRAAVPETSLLAAQHRAPVRTRLRRHRWSALAAGVVIAVVAFGSWRLSGGENSAAPGVRSTVAVGSEDSVDVVQRLSFDSARASLTVSIPTREAPAERFDPRVAELRVRADGRAAPGLGRPLGKGETHRFTFAEPATSVVLTYAVEGTVIKTRPSAPGRALALLTPLTIEGQMGLGSRIEIKRDGVLNLGCIAAGAPMTACGSEIGRHWVVERIAGDPVVDVVAQIDLPEASRP